MCVEGECVFWASKAGMNQTVWQAVWCLCLCVTATQKACQTSGILFAALFCLHSPVSPNLLSCPVQIVKLFSEWDSSLFGKSHKGNHTLTAGRLFIHLYSRSRSQSDMVTCLFWSEAGPVVWQSRCGSPYIGLKDSPTYDPQSKPVHLSALLISTCVQSPEGRATCTQNRCLCPHER